MEVTKGLLESCYNRIDGLDSYINSKEINQIYHLTQQIEVGRLAALEAEQFLLKVPVGEYDQDRKKYNKIIMEAL